MVEVFEPEQRSALPHYDVHYMRSRATNTLDFTFSRGIE